LKKILAYCKWGGLKLNARKCAVTGILHHDRLTRLTQTLPGMKKLLKNGLDKTLVVDGVDIPYLPPDQPYPYLGVQICMNLNFKHHIETLFSTIQK
jgi:hypothetical protein